MNKLFVVSLFAMFALAACSGGSSESILGGWKLVSYGSPSVQTLAVPDIETSIDFNPEGKMTGNVGCNGFGGSYSVGGDTITFGPIESTLMFCEGPVGEQELGVFTVLTESTTFTLDGNTLTITSADGNSVVVLERK